MAQANVNVQSIQIMLKSNIPGQKDLIPFTKAVLYHPDLSDTDGLNEYPFISSNVKIPYDKLRNNNYSDIVRFFFDKPVFQMKCAKELDNTTTTSLNEKEIQEILEYNIEYMLKLLFPTVIPVTKNVTKSFESNINDDGTSLFKMTRESAFELTNNYTFSFIKVGGKEYTVNRIVWLNDVINNPEYSKLFEEFSAFQLWSIATLKKLLVVKKQLYVKMVDTCRDELTSKDNIIDPNKNNSIPDVGDFDITKAFGSGIAAIKTLQTALKEDDKTVSNRGKGKGGHVNDMPPRELARNFLTRTNIDTIILTELDEKIVKELARLAWRVAYFEREESKSNKKTIDDAIRIDKKYNEIETIILKLEKNDTQSKVTNKAITNKAIELYINYETCKMPKSTILFSDIDGLKREHAIIQGYIDKLLIERMNDIIDTIVSERGSTFSRPLQTFAKKLLALENENKNEIVAVMERIVDNKGKQQLPAKYSYLNEISEKVGKFSSENRELSTLKSELTEELTENTIQKLLNDYVYRKEPASSVKTFIEAISKFKKDKKINSGSPITSENDLYTGIVELKNDDAKLPGYLIHIACDVFGGKIDASSVGKAKCAFSETKLKQMLNDIRQGITDSKIIVKPGPFFNLDDIKVEPKENKNKQRPTTTRPRSKPKPRPTTRTTSTSTRKQPVRGGRHTHTRRIRRN